MMLQHVSARLKGQLETMPAGAAVHAPASVRLCFPGDLLKHGQLQRSLVLRTANRTVSECLGLLRDVVQASENIATF